MSAYPNKTQSFAQIFYKSVRSLFLVFRQTILFILLIVIAKDLYVYLGGLPANNIISSLIIIFILLVIIYFWCAILVSANAILSDQPTSFSAALMHVNSHLVQAMLSYILYLLGAVAIYYLAQLVVFIADHIWGAKNWAHGYIFGVLTFLLIMYWLVLMMMAPITVLFEQANAWHAFKLSATFVIKRFWSVFGLLVFLIAIYTLVSPDTLHGHFIEKYYMNAPFDFVVFSVMLPTIANMMLLMWHDLQLRQNDHPVQLS